MRSSLVIGAVRAEDFGEHHANIRTFEPPNPEDVCITVYLSVGPRGGEVLDWFSMRVATPAGLARVEPTDGIVAAGHLLVMQTFELARLWSWLEKTVESCAAGTWNESINRLRHHFHWGR